MAQSKTSPSALAGYTHVNIRVASEEREYLVKMTPNDVKRIKPLLKRYQRTGEWADEINTILDRSEEITFIATINTMGDGGGWYEGDDE